MQDLTQLTRILNYEVKVVVEGNHSWSEFIIFMILNTGKSQNFNVTVDNTFNSINWTIIELQEISIWKEYLGDSDLAMWYNLKAKSETELRNIENHLVLNQSMLRIENKMVTYLDKKIKDR